MTNQNAYKGTYFEELFCREIAKDPQNIREIVEAFSEFVPKNQKIKLVEREGQYGEKSDALISTTGGHNFRASIKSFKGQGFNQVTRMTIENFVTRFDLSDKFRQILEKSTIRKARDSRTNWISSEDSDFIVRELNNKAFDILRYSLLGQDSPELFVFIEADSQIISVYKMEELLEFLRKSINVKITSRGVISLHSCFTIQRKGGNGRHEKRSKDDLTHGGNNIQVKMKCQLLSEMLGPITIIKYNDQPDLVS
ncbi:MAG: hypothetical protein OXU36_23215 [Candidatus Poribacteria bacterium]|nr:hypothetical protein [Candidatus Poribacteria bacterium]